jgi:hypothetical protein
MGDSSVFSGTMPMAFCRARMVSRIASYPMSNCPEYRSAHSLKMWCGACAAPGQKYRKNGFSGAMALASWTNSMALSVRSVVR